MFYRTRHLVANTEIRLGRAEFVRPGDEFFATDNDADYYLTRGRAREVKAQPLQQRAAAPAPSLSPPPPPPPEPPPVEPPAQPVPEPTPAPAEPEVAAPAPVEPPSEQPVIEPQASEQPASDGAAPAADADSPLMTTENAPVRRRRAAAVKPDAEA
jgi:hypothetical protein